MTEKVLAGGSGGSDTQDSGRPRAAGSVDPGVADALLKESSADHRHDIVDFV